MENDVSRFLIYDPSIYRLTALVQPERLFFMLPLRPGQTQGIFYNSRYGTDPRRSPSP